jgi:hypothetical protein
VENDGFVDYETLYQYDVILDFFVRATIVGSCDVENPASFPIFSAGHSTSLIDAIQPTVCGRGHVGRR